MDGQELEAQNLGWTTCLTSCVVSRQEQRRLMQPQYQASLWKSRGVSYGHGLYLTAGTRRTCLVPQYGTWAEHMLSACKALGLILRTVPPEHCQVGCAPHPHKKDQKLPLKGFYPGILWHPSLPIANKTMRVSEVWCLITHTQVWACRCATKRKCHANDFHPFTQLEMPSWCPFQTSIP